MDGLPSVPAAAFVPDGRFAAVCAKYPEPEYRSGVGHLYPSSRKNPVRIAEISFPGGCYCTGTGFREDVHSKSVIFHPVVDHVDLRLDRITVLIRML